MAGVTGRPHLAYIHAVQTNTDSPATEFLLELPVPAGRPDHGLCVGIPVGAAPTLPTANSPTAPITDQQANYLDTF